MKTILFDIHGSTGHIHATLKMATLLKNAGYQVVYALPVEYWPTVEKHGFLTAHPLCLITLSEMVTSDSETDEFAKMRRSLNTIHPQLVLIDEIDSYKAILYQILNYPTVLSQSMIDTARKKGIPPFTSYRLPSNNIFNRVFIELLWILRISSFWCRLFFKFKTKWTVLHRSLTYVTKKHGIALFKIIEIDRCSSFGIRGIPRLIISPKDFDFPHPEMKNVFRIGPLVSINREGEIDHPRYRILIEYIAHLKSNDSGKVIYVSLGTVSNYDIGRCTKFFATIAKVARWHSNDLFVLSTGKFFDVSRLFPLPVNMMVFESVPQVDLLQKCDIMITHGGMNSITECVFCGVPMLVYPLSRNWDQPGNSARVVYHGLGLRGRIERDAAKTISQKINQIIANHSFYKNNVLNMKKKFEAKNDSTEVVTIIEHLMNSYGN